MNRLLTPKEFDKEFNAALLLELQERLAQMTQERDDIQLRLHAIDHAYNEQQRSENKLIIEQQETIRRQRQFIRTLYTSRKARKSKGSTSGQSNRENGVGAKSGGNAAIICSHEGLHKHYQGPCPHCGAGTIG
jgi:hypothetical protein